ncbi:MAG: AAA family ATPase [Actinobacteria bacterium]|nr:AAA family ATPase [Actinomycetota bacterium]
MSGANDGPARRRRATPLRRALALKPDQLRRRLDPKSLPFTTTADVEPLTGTIGQPRALDAIEFGIQIETRGYNLFVAGLPGSGRTTTARDYVDRAAAARTAPDDWVYVHDFATPDRPAAIRLPAGRGGELQRDLVEFVRAARREIPRAFESEEYDRRQREVLQEVSRRRDELAEELKSFAREREIVLEMTLVGVVSVPVVAGEPLTKEGFEKLPPGRQALIEQRGREVLERTGTYARALHELEKEATERVRALDREVALFALGPLLQELRERYAGHEKLLAWLDAVRDDVHDHLADFRDGEEGGGEAAALLQLGGRRRGDFTRYEVNVFAGHPAPDGAPVVEERNPTYYNLIGRVEYRATLGAMMTDFREIKPGALHRANGGFLVLEALDVLRHPFAWEALKRALSGGEVRIENLAEEYSAVPMATLRPEPIPIDVKVILIGSPLLYHLLYQLDEDFRELFKVKVDFSPDMEWDDASVGHYAAFVRRWVEAAGLRHFDREAVARLVEHGARLRESQRKLSTRLIDVSDVTSEASFFAGEAGRDVVRAVDVERAITGREYRSSLLEQRIQELIADGTIVIDVAGERVGQANGLAILDVGDYSFGKPSRISARVSVGRGGVLSVEREIELSGPIHSKGVLILSGYLSGNYAQERPLALAATLTFEQSYDEVEGDSASSTELYALLSALSGLPLDQGIAVTGSVDQHGEVQAIGGATRKIEGFYAVCKAKGLTGRQGVIVPATNVQHLMLSDEVAEAVRRRRFHVWAVRSVDEGIELLTGRPAAEVHRLVSERLADYAERAKEAAGEWPAETPPVTARRRGRRGEGRGRKGG